MLWGQHQAWLSTMLFIVVTPNCRPIEECCCPNNIFTVFSTSCYKSTFLAMYVSARRNLFILGSSEQIHVFHLAFPLTGKFANCAPEISKIYYKIYREHQNCAAEISVAQYKLSRLAISRLPTRPDLNLKGHN